MSGAMARRGLGWWSLAALLVVSGALLLQHATHAAERAVAAPPPLLDNPKAAGAPQVAVFAGGCFWGVQGVFEHVPGVQRVVAGYAGGAQGTAYYEAVSSGNTGHAEAVQVTFDPALVSYGELLRVFFSVAHDPTQLDRQGPDTGSQYRSAIFYADATQQRLANAYIPQLDAARLYDGAIVTRVVPLAGFYAAEAYHQDFLRRNPDNLYIVYNDLPKIANLQRLLPALYRAQAVTAGAAMGQRP